MDKSKKFEMKGSKKKKRVKWVKGAERVEGGAVGGRRGRRGQRWGQIYFLPAMVLDDGPFSGRCGLRQSGNPQEKRAKGQHRQPPQVAHALFTVVCACDGVGLQFHFSAAIATDILICCVI